VCDVSCCSGRFVAELLDGRSAEYAAAGIRRLCMPLW